MNTSDRLWGRPQRPFHETNERLVTPLGLAAATFNVTTFRFRNDDGSESTATWSAAADANLDIQIGDTAIFRVRIGGQENGTGMTPNVTFIYAKNGGGTNPITTSSSVVRAVSSANFNDEDATTQQITVGSFNAGKMSEDGACTSVGFGASKFCELELAFQPQWADLAVGDYVDIPITVDLGNATFSKTARFTVITASAGSNSSRNGLLIPIVGCMGD